MHVDAMNESSGTMQRVLACLGDPSRFRLVHVLLQHDLCVSEIAGEIGLSQSCTTRHLQTLMREGLVIRSRSGKRVFFRIAGDHPHLARLLEWLGPDPEFPTAGALTPEGEWSALPKRAGKGTAARARTGNRSVRPANGSPGRPRPVPPAATRNDPLHERVERLFESADPQWGALTAITAEDAGPEDQGSSLPMAVSSRDVDTPGAPEMPQPTGPANGDLEDFLL
jgi:DNA-binding transcriptional ArsR family regulator